MTTEKSRNETLLARRAEAVPQGVGNIHQIFASKASNSKITDVDNKEYIDFTSGIAVVNTGHLHPKVTAAVSKQLELLSHTCFHVLMNENYVELAERLNKLVPGDTPKQTFFVTTGAEAVENAIKVARAATKRTGVIAFSGAFHGRTLMAVSLTGKVIPYKKDFGPLAPEVFHAPFPNPLHGISTEEALKGLNDILKYDIEAERVAAIIIEPVQGEGGFYIAPKEFMQALREICDTHGILLICDEVQTGCARTGKMFATEYSDVEPDIMVLAKGLAGGFPLSAVVGKKSIMEAVTPGGIGGTYAGSPISVAAALAALDVIEDEGLVERANHIGEIIKNRITSLSEQFSVISDIRGLGAMVAMELFDKNQQPAVQLTKDIVKLASEKGLLLLPCGIHGNVIRFLTPLTIEDELLDKGLNILDEVLQELTT